ncbi:unnamed protein product [Clonostachys byssicola]|uniref:Serine aminopeptidase S33 domain-containing protein n=1 Tax=Clonostachys byssicola TaxID=160290 RepID=A0A9N9UGA4_9HYPO|nr:unnamed protein product [Clonostachys byssicola]
MASRFVETASSRKLHCLQTGDPKGQLIICLHGLGGSTNTFKSLLLRLPQSYNIICLDFPGFGASPALTERPTVASYVSDLHDIVTFFQAADESPRESKIILIGHSLGSAIVLHFSTEYPSLVATICLLGATRSPSHIPAVQARMLDMAKNTREKGAAWAAELASRSNFPPPEMRDVDEKLRKEVYDAVAASDAEGYALTCEMMADESHKDPDYTKIKCPVLLIAGDLDVISPVERSKGLVDIIGSDLCTLEIVKSGHQPVLEEPDAVGRAVGQMLQRIQA